MVVYKIEKENGQEISELPHGAVEKRKKSEAVDKNSKILERQNELLKLISFRYTKPLKEKLKEIIESVAKTLEVERVSIWNYDEYQSALITEGVYSLSKNEYLPGALFKRSDYPKYFKELDYNRIVDANDAVNDPRTSEFAENYLKPNGISSMMDAPIRLRGNLLGIICQEHVGAARVWSDEDRDFISSIVTIISLAIENDEIEKSHKGVVEQVEKIKNDYQTLKITTEAIKEKEQLLSSIYNAVEDVIFVLEVINGERFRFVSVNKHFLSKTGLTHEQVMGKYVEEVIPPPALNLVLEKYNRACLEKKIVSWEETSDYPTGKVTGEVNIAPLINENGNCTHLVGAVHDITERKKAEKKNRESLDRFRRFAEISHEAIAIHENGKILEVNPSFLKMFGYEESEVIGMSFVKFTAPDSVELLLKKILEGVKEPFEAVGLRKGGSAFYAEVQGRQIEYQGNSVTVATIIDITERKKTAEKIREIFERITDAFVALDKNWCYTYMNKKAGEILNRDSEQMIGKHIWTEFPEEIGQPFYKAYYKARAEQKYVYLEQYYAPYGLWLENHIYPSEDGLSIFFSDITERKTTESNLRMAYQRLVYHLNNTPLAVIEWDENLVIKKWSVQAENLFGWQESEVINKRFNEFGFIFNEDSQSVSVVTKELTGGSVNSNRSINRNNTKTGQVIYCQWYNSVLKDEKGHVLTIMSLIQDITEEKNAENQIRKLNESLEERVNLRTAELIKSNKSLESFASMASHDLRAPLRSIISFTEIIQTNHSSSFNAELKELFEYIFKGAQRMNLIIDDLLKLSMFGKEKPEIIHINMTDLFKKAWENIKSTAGHQVVFELAELPGIEGDISMMEQVVLNLLRNAVKYSSKSERPQIQVGYSETDEEITFFIKDNGVGFDMTYSHKLFGAFQRLHGQEEFEGIGIGLFLVKRIIENHGGTVWAEGKVNEGATFYFSIPKRK